MKGLLVVAGDTELIVQQTDVLVDSLLHTVLHRGQRLLLLLFCSDELGFNHRYLLNNRHLDLLILLEGLLRLRRLKVLHSLEVGQIITK